MKSWMEWIGELLVIALGALGWIFGRSQHIEIRAGDSIHLPAFTKYFFGRPNSDGVYNIRGIYFQILVIITIIPFMLSDFEIISRRDAFQIFFVGMLCFPFFELIRYTKKKL